MHMEDGIPILFYTNGLKQGCPLSPTLLSLSIDDSKQMPIKFVEEEGIE